MKQKSKNKSEKSQLLSKSKGCNKRYGFRGNCDFQGKLGMCPSLAEPDSGGFPKTSRRQTKSFRCSSFSKMLPRCGRVAHICEANCILQQVFSDAIAFFKTCQFAIDYLYEVSYKFGQGNGAIAARWQAKAGVEPPFAGRERPFSLRRIALRKTNCVRFGRIASLSACVLFAGGCVFLNCL